MSGTTEKAVAFVVTRLSSSRLPRKQLRTIGDVSVLDRIMSELAEVEAVDQVVLATVAEPDNEPLRVLAEERGWTLFWYEGEVDDVVGRLHNAAQSFAAEICLLISADCPLVHGPSVGELVAAMRAEPQADYVGMLPDERGRVSLLEGVHVARSRAWQRADAMSDRPELREHQFPVIYQRPDAFTRLDVRLSTAVYGEPHRLSIDTWADLEFMHTLHERLKSEGKVFDLPAVVGLLEAEPLLRSLNSHVHQRRLVETVHRVLFIVDAGGPFGYGHLMRCRELAGQVVERLGWPVTFVLDDEHAAQSVEACGFRVLWDALGRQPTVAPCSRSSVAFSELAHGHDLVVVDLSARRDLQPGWRERVAADYPVVVIDREDSTAAEADLIVCPGITGRPAQSASPMPPVASGLEFAIIRREIRRYIGLDIDKDIDVLVYLHDEVEREAVSRLAAAQGWTAVVLTGFREGFPELLARSKVFLSGYGQTFYEALALRTFPVAWPLSALHRADAEAFYAAVALPKYIVADVAGLGSVLQGALNESLADAPKLTDGTPAIVRRLAELRKTWA